jgi:predicted transcriptional regulator
MSKQDLYNLQSALEDVEHILVKERRCNGVTQEQLGEELGVTRTQIAHDESEGYQHASLSKLKRVVNALIRIT